MYDANNNLTLWHQVIHRLIKIQESDETHPGVFQAALDGHNPVLKKLTPSRLEFEGRSTEGDSVTMAG